MGNSGPGIFSLNSRFIGVSVEKKRFAFSNLQILGLTINNEKFADHHPETKIISADAIFFYLATDGPYVS